MRGWCGETESLGRDLGPRDTGSSCSPRTSSSVTLQATRWGQNFPKPRGGWILLSSVTTSRCLIRPLWEDMETGVPRSATQPAALQSWGMAKSWVLAVQLSGGSPPFAWAHGGPHYMKWHPFQCGSTGLEAGLCSPQGCSSLGLSPLWQGAAGLC